MQRPDQLRLTDRTTQADESWERPEVIDPPGPSIARRLVIAFVASCLLALICWVVLPRFDVWLPPWIPLVSFVVIMAAAIISARPDTTPDDAGGSDPRGTSCCDDGRPVCCSGPRPLRIFRESPKPPKR